VEDALTTEVDVPRRTGPTIQRGRSKQDYGTPGEFIRAVEKRFGKIEFDLAASPENAKAERFYNGEVEDALKYAWGNIGGNLWLNPPFADIEPWAAKCAEHWERRDGFILFLTPASIGSNWFESHVRRHAYVLGLSPRMTFEGTTDPYPKDLMLSVYGFGLHGFGTWRWK
jgi:phage N-6-adenine-methyltransferase